MVLLTRTVAVSALNAVLGLLASAASGAAAALTFGWLIPMTAVCALAASCQGRDATGRGRRMSTYWFELEVGPVGDLDEAAEQLYSLCGDGQLAGDEHGGTVVFSREALNSVRAILSAIDDCERSGLAVTGVMEDVTAEDIAEKTSRSGQAVGHWITGERGPGGFPAPVIHRGTRVKLYSWAESRSGCQ